jgi:dynein heavy chain
MEEWIQNHIQVAGFEKKYWNEKHSEITRDFFNNARFKCLFVTVDVSSNEIIIYIDQPPPLSESRMDVTCFIRKEEQVLNDASQVSSQLITCTIPLQQTAHSVRNIIEHQIFPSVFSRKWNDTSRKELIGLYQRLMASLTESSNDEQGTTSLYIPRPVDLQQHDEPTTAIDSTTVQQYESIVIHWIRQIKSVLNSHEHNVSLDRLGPMDELSFWVSRSQDLTRLSHQLESPDAAYILNHLDTVQSKFSKAVKALGPALLDGTHEAETRVKYLTLLESPCHKLYNLLPSEIPDILLEFIFCIRFIHSQSEYFCTNERISCLTRKILTEIIKQCSSNVRLDEIYHGDVNASIKRLKECIICGRKWNDLYNRTALTVNQTLQNDIGNLSSKRWIQNDSTIFAQLDAFIQRCEDLIEICRARIQFVHLIDLASDKTRAQFRPVFFGTCRGQIENSLQSIKKGFFVQLNKVASLEYNVLDPQEVRWNEDFNSFKLAVQDFDSSFCKTVAMAMDQPKDIFSSTRLFITWRRLSFRESIVLFVDKKVEAVRSMFFHEIRTIQSEFDDSYRDPPIRVNECKTSGSVRWGKSLQSRLESYWKALRNAEEESHAIPDDSILAAYNSLITSLESYQRQQYSNWLNMNVNGVEADDILDRLNVPILKRVSGTIICNFDLQLICILEEAFSWHKMGYELPSVILGLFHQMESIKLSRERVMTLVRTYNQGFASLTGKKHIYREQWKIVDKRLSPAFTKLFFSARLPLIDKFVHSILTKIREIRENAIEDQAFG